MVTRSIEATTASPESSMITAVGQEFRLVYGPTPRLEPIGVATTKDVHQEEAEEAPSWPTYREVWWLTGTLQKDIHLLRPVRVELEWQPYGVASYQRELLVHAVGDDAMDALGALRDRLLDLYEDVMAREDSQLSDRMKARRRILLTVVSSRAGA
jgi:hypothetical protein